MEPTPSDTIGRVARWSAAILRIPVGRCRFGDSDRSPARRHRDDRNVPRVAGFHYDEKSRARPDEGSDGAALDRG